MKIIVEGDYKTGKSTVVEIIYDALRKHGFNIEVSELEMRDNRPSRAIGIDDRIAAIAKRGKIYIETRQSSRIAKMNLSKFIEIAKSEASKSKHKSRVGAVIFDRGEVVSVGYNQTRSARHITKRFVRWPNSIHAEVDAIIKAKVSLKGKSIIVVRLNKRGELRLAKPCQFCQMYIEHVGIKYICYSTSSNEIVSLKIS